METNEKIKEYLGKLERQLIYKNDVYGDSLQNPIAVFQKNKKAGILGRIDDKLNRIKTVGINSDTEDTINDLIGYLVHLKLMIDEEA